MLLNYFLLCESLHIASWPQSLMDSGVVDGNQHRTKTKPEREYVRNKGNTKKQRSSTRSRKIQIF